MKRKRYTLLTLLEKQPKALKKCSEFIYLANLFNSSSVLKQMSLSLAAYRLLNRVQIKSDSIERFLKFYKLPANAFFPLFLLMKKKYLDKTTALKKKKEENIRKILNNLSSSKKIILKSLLEDEKKYNIKITLWRKYFFPNSLKKAEKLIKISNIELSEIIESFMEDFKKKYDNCISIKYKKVLCKFIMETALNKISPGVVRKNYRELSKKYHPDLGGDPAHFKKLSEAKNILLGY
ncbi:MAG TPA: hypothetical protein PLG34_09445 [Spirochaetota bacterium]|jgi:hypothetical protein|nr:MAG: DnaJ domain protein [Spirochaetes bacterium ADurb.Bin133]HNZ28010.1 hypothetical protein [Spirochaetota bacterium]HPY88193.1 hypothetical protein [Spirochaetota bacterium]HQB60754.1 hypothetical protein [Spirochaetota bacterium]